MSKARFWTGVCYPENMIADWEDRIGDIVQVPFVYCIHNADTTSKSEEDRKEHVHVILAYPNTTTENHALNTLLRLSSPGRVCCPKVFQVIGIRNMYDYLIHATDSCKKAFAKGDTSKRPYRPDERIEGNNFDIGCYEQVSLADKRKICRELAEDIVKHEFVNFLSFYVWVMNTYEDQVVFDVVQGNSGFFERLCKGNYQKMRFKVQEDQQNQLAACNDMLQKILQIEDGRN